MLDKRKGRSVHSSGAGRVFLRWATRFAWLLGTLFVAALVLVHIPQTRVLILESLTHGLESETEVSITCKGFWWLPFLGIHVRDLDVRIAGRRILECRKASLNFDLSLVRPWLVLDTLRLDNPVLHLQKIDGRFMIFPKTVRKGGAAAGSVEHARSGAGFVLMRAPLLKIEIHSGVILAEQNGARVLEVKGVDGSLMLDSEGVVRAPFLNLDPFQNRD